MKKKTTVQSINEHSTPPSEETKIQKHEVPGLMTLSDSILSGAVVEYRKAGYSLPGTYIQILRFIGFFPVNVIWISSRKPSTVQRVSLLCCSRM